MDHRDEMITLAEEVAAVRNELLDLREDIKILAAHAPHTHRHAEKLSLATVHRLDRIAAMAPQRATNRLGQLMSVHRPDRCGFVFAGDGWPSCLSCNEPGGWQALYVLPNGAA